MADDAVTPLSRRTAGTARRLWRLVHVRAVAYLVAGAVLLVNPDEGLSWLRWVIGLAILAQGALLAVENVPGQRADQGDLSWRFVAGLLSVAAGLLVVLWPSMTAPLLFLVVGVWACAAGVAGVVAGLRGRAVRAKAWDWQLVNAVLWIVLGIVILARPTDDAPTIALLLSTYLLLAGAVLLVAGLSTGTRQKDRDTA
ncbi:HdeD family acid-resistance protein [Isoptericola sp. 178]|uniref:HdeD family acid-resistance protein n=1 Tax=Isoptericola sp. 178 TaxID=3064651 RepID=UPI0027122E02|nr:DUF308 domain-containing protein [Isoptericola sp. 178]MDO8145577.1 DUF308 domain-containing protein [Isoptericola sp. 178]